MFICPNCNKEVKRLIANKYKLGCDFCIELNKIENVGDLHISANNKYAPKMTIAEKNHIINRYLGKDGKVHFTHKRYDSKYTY